MMYSCTHKHMLTPPPECDDHYIEPRNRDLFLLTQICQYGLLIKQSFSPFYSPCLPHILPKQTYWLGFQERIRARKNKYKLWAQWQVMKVWQTCTVNFRRVLCWALDPARFCEAALMIWPEPHVPVFLCAPACMSIDVSMLGRMFIHRRVFSEERSKEQWESCNRHIKGYKG